MKAAKTTIRLADPSSGSKDLDWYFPPNVDHGHGDPCGSRVLVQLKRPEIQSRGGILLTQNTIETDLWNTEVGLVLSIGALAYRNRETMKEWPEGAWCKPGDYVRVPKYGGSRWVIDLNRGSEWDKVMFLVIDDHNVISKVRDPLKVKAFI